MSLLPFVELSPSGIASTAQVFVNLSPAAFVEQSLANGEGVLTDSGALSVSTGARTGRSPKDRYVVRDAETERHVDWGNVNQPVDRETFDRLYNRAAEYLRQKTLYVSDGEACADPAHRLRVRTISEFAWHALFARCLFRRPLASELALFQPEWKILAAPRFRADPARDGTRTEAFIGLDFGMKRVLIVGTEYAGEIKKSVFSALNYLLPFKGVFPMHCAANIGTRKDVALFFGLSGTGKTTLSADPRRRLIGDDEHGWAKDGVFNIEGGCYAKTVRLSVKGEPQIWNAIKFGAVIENVAVDPVTRIPDYNNVRVTENTRVAYPIEHIPGCEPSGRGGIPSNIFFLTCDAFGVLPPLSRLTTEQAMYHFLSGYTAKVAGTEAGVTDPETTFSTCFGAPFLPLHPTKYAEMLRQKLERHRTPVWLVNTGWTGGPYGEGSRMSLPHTRSLLAGVLSGALDNAAFEPDPVFGILVPKTCPGVPNSVLKPRQTWPDGAQYDVFATKLARRFRENFAKYADQAPEAVRAAGPRV